MPPLPALDSWTAASATEAVFGVRVLVGAIGFVLLVAGARVYRLGLLLTAFGSGVVAAVLGIQWFSPYLSFPPSTAGAVAVGLGVAAAVVVAWVHRWGLVAMGGWLGAMGATMGADWFFPPAPWWAGLAGGAVGALAMPWVFRMLLRFVTPVVGAALLMWAFQRLDQPWWFVPLAVLGVAIQTGLVRSPPGSGEDQEES